MDELMPLLFVVFIVWGMVGSVIKAVRKSQGSSKTNPQARRNSAAPKTRFPASAFAPDPKTDSGEGAAAPAAREGIAPPHVSPSHRLRDSEYGSLPGGSMEGIDPCHDSPGAMSPGSLSYNSSEGLDPCHDDWAPASPSRIFEPESDSEASAGLNLSWTGNDIVRGFICSEILKRKVS